MLKLAYIKDGRIHQKTYEKDSEAVTAWYSLEKTGYPIASIRLDENGSTLGLKENFRLSFERLPLEEWPDEFRQSVRENLPRKDYRGATAGYCSESEILYFRHVYLEYETSLDIRNEFYFDSYGNTLTWVDYD